ncbi:hypothetical protein Tco_1568728, partial [Tanacetum coccineum]
DEVFVDVATSEKDKQSTKLDDSTTSEAITTASVKDSAAPTIQVSTADIGEVTAAEIDELTLAQTLIEIKAAKPKVVTTAATTTRPKVPLKRKDQIALDEQITRDIQAKLDVELEEEQKLARKQQEEANIALIEEELTDEEKGKLFMELIEKRRKHFATLRAQEKRNRYTYKQLKGKNFDEIQNLFDKEKKRVNTFVAMGSEEHESKEKKTEDKEFDEVKEISKDDEGELLKHLVIKKDEDIAIDAIPLATKLPVIVDYKLHKEGMLVHYQLIRADGSSKRYSSMIRMLQGIDREDLEVLWRIVKAKHNDTRPEDEFERVLWGDLKVMFEPDTTSDVWRMLQGYRVTIWKLIDSSGVHFVSRKVNERFECIPPEYDEEFVIKKLEDSEAEHQSKVITVSIKISTAGTYYCLCSVSAAGYKDTTVADLQLLEDLLLSRG